MARSETLPSSADILEHLDIARAVVEAVRARTPPYREVVVLRYCQSLPSAEIARRQGVTWAHSNAPFAMTMPTERIGAVLAGMPPNPRAAP